MLRPVQRCDHGLVEPEGEVTQSSTDCPGSGQERCGEQMWVARSELEAASPEAGGSHVQGPRPVEEASWESYWPYVVSSAGRPIHPCAGHPLPTASAKVRRPQSFLGGVSPHGAPALRTQGLQQCAATARTVHTRH